MAQQVDARAGVSRVAILALVIGIFFTTLAGLMIAGAMFGFGAGIFTVFYFITLFLILFLVVGILGLVVAYRTCQGKKESSERRAHGP